MLSGLDLAVSRWRESAREQMTQNARYAQEEILRSLIGEEVFRWVRLPDESTRFERLAAVVGTRVVWQQWIEITDYAMYVRSMWIGVP